MQDLTAAEACQELGGIAGTTLATLRATGVIAGDQVGRTVRYQAADVAQLRDAPAPPAEPAWIVRLGRSRFSEVDDRWIGWDESWSEGRKREAARQWWRIADPDRYVGQTLVATVAQWAVGAWRIAPGGKIHFGLASFQVDSHPDPGAWIGSRFPISGGPVVLHWPPKSGRSRPS
ncbi:hypothetical protein JOF34_001835 [Microbacterium amylolyticum]|uniref:Helix-turn-helix domain-containing protein n=1 Tax=Microbacterium amylolyticum TaxID=936337 RepID=A0ABS4ZIY2_9MICO|nr:hypothetical protein [Microbacterium amylolyticum]